MLRRQPSRRAIATVLFTDIVGSTERATALGDRGWRELLTRHHRLVRRLLRRHGGREVDTAGDGFFATFASPADAIGCALDMADALTQIGIEIRAGIHTGEVEPMGSKVGGIAVHLGARIMSAAGPREVLVSSTARELASGAGFVFIDRGAPQLKGVAEAWHLYEARRPSPAPAPVADASVEAPWWRSARGRLIAVVAGGGAVLALAVIAVLLLRQSLSGTAAIGPNVIRSLALDGQLGTGWAVGRGPRGVAISADALWIVNTDGRTVSRVNPATGQTSVIGVGGATEVATSGDLVWVLDAFSSSVTILRAGDGSRIGRVETHGRALAVDHDDVWLADDIADAVHRIDARTRSIKETIRLPAGTGPSSIAARDGSVWTANSLASTVSRIDAGRHAVTNPAIAITSSPTGITAAASGIWVISEVTDTLYRIDPATNRVVSQRPVCDRPISVAADANSVWVACAADHAVWRIPVAGGDPIITSLAGSPGGLLIDGNRAWVTIGER